MSATAALTPQALYNNSQSDVALISNAAPSNMSLAVPSSAGQRGRLSVARRASRQTETQQSETVPPLTTDNDAELRVGADTPDTEIIEVPARPDITIYCQGCDRFIDLRSLNEHRFYHRSLDIMRYHGSNRPQSTDGLLKRRRAILRKMKRETTAENPLDPAELNKLNEAYEFLKSDLEDTFEAYRQIRENTTVDVKGVALNCSAACALAVGICSDANQRWKNHMEDTRVFQDYFGNDVHKCYFGIYDGHHGRFAAEITANELHHGLLMEMEKFDPRTKCTCTFNMADSYDISQYEIHSRPGTASTARGQIHETSSNIIQQIISTCEEKLASMENQQNEKAERGANSSRSKKEKSKKTKDPFSAKMGDAFKKAHKYTDMLLSWGKDEMSRVRWSGTSTLACVIQNKHQPNSDTNSDPAEMDSSEGGPGSNKNSTEKAGDADVKPNTENTVGEEASLKGTELQELGYIHLANAGNSQAVLVRGNRAYRISRDHTPKSQREKTRVIREGGTISESERELRVNGVLSTTRGLGNHGDPALKRCVITEPYTTSVKIDQYAQFLILASHGVWEVFSEDEAAALLMQVFPNNHVPAPSRVSASVNRLLDGPQSIVVTPSDLQSDVATDYQAANRKEAQRLRTREGNKGQDQGGILRPSTGQSLKTKSVVSIHIEEESTDTDTEIDDPAESDQKSRDETVSSSYGNTSSSQGISSSDASKTGPGRRKNQDTKTDLLTEIGSCADGYMDYDNESGNEADVDTTFTDIMTLGTFSRASQHVPTREEFQREFAKGLSERLVQAALLAGAKDNITAMVILFPGCGL